jgi:general secretion pathway protein K
MAVLSQQRGFVLVVVLLSLSLLSIAAMAVIASSRSATQSARALHDRALTMAAADGGIQQAMFVLLQAPENPVSLRLSAIIGQVRVRIEIENQAGKINPSLASLPLLRGLLIALGENPRIATTIAEAIVDARTPAPMSVGGGLKSDIYRSAGLNYGPPGRLFHSINELGMLPGVTPALLVRLRPYLCLYLENAVAPDAATGPVQQALALAESDEVSFPAPDRVFQITAIASGPGRTRFVRMATVRRRPDASGAPQILSWESGEPPLLVTGGAKANVEATAHLRDRP